VACHSITVARKIDGGAGCRDFGFSPVDIATLVSVGLLKPLGQPRVARYELPWVIGQKNPTPAWAASLRRNLILK